MQKEYFKKKYKSFNPVTGDYLVEEVHFDGEMKVGSILTPKKNSKKTIAYGKVLKKGRDIPSVDGSKDMKLEAEVNEVIMYNRINGIVLFIDSKEYRVVSQNNIHGVFKKMEKNFKTVENFKPLMGWYLVTLVEPEQQKVGSLYIPDAVKEAFVYGRVIKTGRDLARGTSGDDIPLEAIEGDVIIFGEKSAGTKLMTLEGHHYYLVNQNNILGVFK